MKIQSVPVGKLSPHPKNSRTHSPEQITALARAVQEWGFTQPVVTDEHHVILIGHGRVEAAKALGLAEVPVVVLKGLSDERKRALLLSDNRLAEIGSRWDEGVLADELRWLMDADFDVTLTTFDLPEQGLSKDSMSPANDEAAEPTSRPGDVWHLGRHRLVCAEPWPDRMPGILAAMGNPHPRLLVTASLAPEGVGCLTTAEADVAYVWHLPQHASATFEAIEAAGFEIRSQIVRLVDPTPRGRYARGHVPGWYAVRKGAKADWRGGRSQSTVWEDDGIFAAPGGLPLDLWAQPMQNHLPKGGVILDPFAGTGNGLVAAEQTGRSFAGIEPEPALVDHAIERWQLFTGQEARHKDGDTFQQIRDNRGDEGEAGAGEGQDGAGAS